jgi:hypothetical protein
MELIILIIVIAVIGGALRIAAGMWFAYNAFNAARVIQQAYDQAVQQQFYQLGLAIQQHQAAAARQAEYAARQRIAQLPPMQRPAHEQRLNEIVSKRAKLNTRTGEWE